MPWRLTSSKKMPSPWTRRLSSLRGMLCPAKPFCGASTCSGAAVVAVLSLTSWSPPPRRRRDRLDDVHIARAAADVPLDRTADLVLRRLRIVVEQVLRAHQHPGRAVAALERVVIREGLLERMELAARRERLDGLDGRPVGLDGGQHAGLDRRAVEDDGARTAVPGVAPDVRPGQVEVVADEVDEQAPRLDLPLVDRPV